MPVIGLIGVVVSAILFYRLRQQYPVKNDPDTPKRSPLRKLVAVVGYMYAVRNGRVKEEWPMPVPLRALLVLAFVVLGLLAIGYSRDWDA